jgi:hypothetical protein
VLVWPAAVRELSALVSHACDCGLAYRCCCCCCFCCQCALPLAWLGVVVPTVQPMRLAGVLRHVPLAGGVDPQDRGGASVAPAPRVSRLRVTSATPPSTLAHATILRRPTHRRHDAASVHCRPRRPNHSGVVAACTNCTAACTNCTNRTHPAPLLPHTRHTHTGDNARQLGFRRQLAPGYDYGRQTKHSGSTKQHVRNATRSYVLLTTTGCGCAGLLECARFTLVPPDRRRKIFTRAVGCGAVPTNVYASSMCEAVAGVAIYTIPRSGQNRPACSSPVRKVWGSVSSRTARRPRLSAAGVATRTLLRTSLTHSCAPCPTHSHFDTAGTQPSTTSQTPRATAWAAWLPPAVALCALLVVGVAAKVAR